MVPDAPNSSGFDAGQLANAVLSGCGPRRARGTTRTNTIALTEIFPDADSPFTSECLAVPVNVALYL
jgi:hypothetical protein